MKTEQKISPVSEAFFTVKNLKNAKYLLPNAITVLSLYFGLSAILFSFEARMQQSLDYYIKASHAIIYASICDFMDGAVARLTKTTSTFGAQMDSLCDLVVFGVTPAFLVYNFGLHEMNHGFLLSFMLVAAGALRLARFNMYAIAGTSSPYSTGIPIPVPAVLFATIIMTYGEFQKSREDWISQYSSLESLVNFVGDRENVKVILAFYVVILSVGMVSTIKYFSNKKLKLPEGKLMKLLFVSVIVTGSVLLKIHFIFSSFFLITVYCIHGPIMFLLNLFDNKHYKI